MVRFTIFVWNLHLSFRPIIDRHLEGMHTINKAMQKRNSDSSKYCWPSNEMESWEDSFQATYQDTAKQWSFRFPTLFSKTCLYFIEVHDGPISQMRLFASPVYYIPLPLISKPTNGTATDTGFSLVHKMILCTTNFIACMHSECSGWILYIIHAVKRRVSA